MTNMFILIVCLLSLVHAAGKMDDRFTLYHPLHNSTFKHWKASGSSVFQTSRTILTPAAVNQKGLIYAKHTFNLQNFEMEIDLSIHNSLNSAFAQGHFMIYFLRDNPMKSAWEFSKGLDGLFDGLLIHIFENAVRNKEKSLKSDPSRLHKISSYLRDEEMNLIKTPYIPECELHFEDQTMYIHSKDGKFDVFFKDKKTGKESLKPCLSIKFPEHYFSEDHDIYMFIAADSGPQIPQSHVIHNIKFWDTNHLHDTEDQDSAEEKREFHAKPKDVMR
jgi:hypothetical protein